MKKIIIMSMALKFATFHVAATETNHIHEINQLLTEVTGWKSDAGPTADGRILLLPPDAHYFAFDNWNLTPEYARLNEIVSQHWESILENIEEITVPSENHRIIMYRALGETLPRKDALLFFKSRLDSHDSIDENDDAFFLAYDFFYYHIENALAINPEDPTATAILHKLKLLYAHDPEVVEHCDLMLSGKINRGGKKEYLSPILPEISTEEAKVLQYGIANSEDAAPENIFIAQEESPAANVALPVIASEAKQPSWLWFLALPAAVIAWFAVRRARRKT